MAFVCKQTAVLVVRIKKTLDNNNAVLMDLKAIFSRNTLPHRGLPFSMYAPRGGGWGQAPYTFPLRTKCKKGVGGSR